MFIDTHAHLNFEAFKDDWREVVERAADAGVRKMVVVGTDLDSSCRAIELSSQHEALYAAVGIHPHHVKQIENGELRIENAQEELEKLAQNPKVVAIGEVGLDYHVYQASKRYTEEQLAITPHMKNLQKKLLGMQMEIAKKLDKPLILHSREAGEDVLDVLEHYSKIDGKMPRGVFHCFDGSKKYAVKILTAGLYISFTGNVTFLADRASVAMTVPLERLLLETDSPLIKPYRVNERCEPIDVLTIAKFHAQQRKVNLEEIERQTASNAERLFKL